MASSIKPAQRIAIWVIAITMAVGTLGAYFISILDTSNSRRDQEKLQQQLQEAAKDPTAHIVSGDVTELQIEDLRAGTGEEVKAGDTITMHYKGTIAQTGVKFDSSYDTGEPATFNLSELIVGWQEGVPGTKVGGKRRLIIPSDKAYGSQPSDYIPANSDLVFEIEVLDRKPAE